MVTHPTLNIPMTPQEIQDKIEAIIASPKRFIKCDENEIRISNGKEYAGPTITITRETGLFSHTYTVYINLCIIPVESARKLWIQAEESYARQIYAASLEQLNTLHYSLVNTSDIKH